MRDELTLEFPVSIVYENGEEERVGWVAEAPVECHLSPVSEAVIEWAQTSGVRATWAIRCPLDLEEVPPLTRATVRGGDIADGTAWQLLVEITADRGRVGRRVHKLLVAVDAELN
jgi:hypothetical protein